MTIEVRGEAGKTRKFLKICQGKPASCLVFVRENLTRSLRLCSIKQVSLAAGDVSYHNQPFASAKRAASIRL